jgi:hypothetical protein
VEKPGYMRLDKGKDRLRRNVFIPGIIQKETLHTHESETIYHLK